MYKLACFCILCVLASVLYKYSRTLSSKTKWFTYKLLCVLADTLDAFLSTFSSSCRPGTDFIESTQHSELDTLSDAEIIQLKLKTAQLRPGYSVYQITPTTVAKVSQDLGEEFGDASEANALELVFTKTTIPVPRVRRVVKRKWDYLSVMDYVKGPTLDQIWPTLSLARKIGIAFTLRSYVRQLRRLKAPLSTPPGPLSATGPRICESPIFGQVQSHRGPFSSYAELSAFFNKRCKMALDAAHIPAGHFQRQQRFDDSEPLVFTHQDINPRNIIVGEDGRLWVIDWAWAGYYPPWFEYVAMQRQSENEKILGFRHDFWGSFIPFICGPYFTQESWLEMMSLGLYFV